MNAMTSITTKRGLLKCRSRGAEGLEGKVSKVLKVIELVSSAIPSYIGIPNHENDLVRPLLMELVDTEVTLTAECFGGLIARWFRKKHKASGENSTTIKADGDSVSFLESVNKRLKSLGNGVTAFWRRVKEKMTTGKPGPEVDHSAMTDGGVVPLSTEKPFYPIPADDRITVEPCCPAIRTVADVMLQSETRIPPSTKTAALPSEKSPVSVMAGTILPAAQKFRGHLRGVKDKMQAIISTPLTVYDSPLTAEAISFAVRKLGDFLKDTMGMSAPSAEHDDAMAAVRSCPAVEALLLCLETYDKLLTDDDIMALQKFIEDNRRELETPEAIHNLNFYLDRVPVESVQGLAEVVTSLPLHFGKWSPNMVVPSLRNMCYWIVYKTGRGHRTVQAMIKILNAYDRIQLDDDAQAIVISTLRYLHDLDIPAVPLMEDLVVLLFRKMGQTIPDFYSACCGPTTS